MPIIDDILDTLKNGHWHDIEEISERTQLTKLKVELVTNFLSEYNFVEIDKKEHKTRLTPPLLSFIKKIQTIETKEEY